MKHLRSALCILLSLALLFCALPTALAAPKGEVTGKCGPSVGYTLNTQTGELVIGLIGGAKSGKMSDFESGESPFFGNEGIKTVCIAPWVCSIGSEAFSGCKNLETVSVPFTVSEIGAHAFDGCSKAVIQFEGTENDWAGVKIGAGNDWKDDPARVVCTLQGLDRVGATIPAPRGGDVVKLPAPLAVEECDKYTAEVIAVRSEAGGKNVDLQNGDTLQANTAYTFRIAFEPKEGFALQEGTAAFVNGEAQTLEFGVVSVTFTTADADRIDEPRYEAGTLHMLAYNVSGIPLIGDFQGSTFTLTNDRAKKLGTLLNGTDVDFISVEEDFNGHEHLAAQMTNYPYRSYTSGGVVQGQGLNVFSVHKLYNIERVKWKFEFGTLSGSSDALSNKGFLYSLMELAPGVYINVITVHCDAGYEPLSVKARSTNFKQLADYINENLNDGRALIVQGDFNFKFKRELKDDLVGNLMEPTGLTDVWAELYNGGLTDPSDPAFKRDAEGDDLDRVLYRSGDYLMLTPVSKTVPPLTGKNGERYTDHDPMLTEFNYLLTGSEPQPEALTVPTQENKALLTLKEVLWTLVRLVQAVLGLLELPYLIVQGAELLINGKMP